MSLIVDARTYDMISTNYAEFVIYIRNFLVCHSTLSECHYTSFLITCHSEGYAMYLLYCSKRTQKMEYSPEKKRILLERPIYELCLGAKLRGILCYYVSILD